MRASTRRLHHSSPRRRGSGRAAPGPPFRGGSARFRSRAARSPKRSASSSTVTGPLDSSQPRRISATASSRVAGSGTCVASGGESPVRPRRPDSDPREQFQALGTGPERRAARPSASSRGAARRVRRTTRCHASTGGTTTSVSSASCSSSASRTSGHDDSRDLGDRGRIEHARCRRRRRASCGAA